MNTLWTPVNLPQLFTKLAYDYSSLEEPLCIFLLQFEKILANVNNYHIIYKIGTNKRIFRSFQNNSSGNN